jgi:hypothetical protein
MKTFSTRRFGALAIGLLLAVGCSQDRSTGPASISAPTAVAQPDLLGGVVGGLTSVLKLTTVSGLQRSTPLPNDITVERTIGIYGGTLSIPAAGVTVVVPIGALPGPTQITMTARKGSLVAYDFGPHGITFRVPLIFTQKLNGTNATVLNAPLLKLSYYGDSSLLGQTTALVSDLIGGVVNLLNWSFTAPIKHFSGYLVSW